MQVLEVLKTMPGGQGKKFSGKGKGVKPPDKGKKNVVKASTSCAVTSVGPSSNLRSKLHDKGKVTAAMIQELTEELQAKDRESLKMTSRIQKPCKKVIWNKRIVKIV